MREEDAAKMRWIAKEAAKHCHRDITSIGFMARLSPILRFWCGAVRTSPIILIRSPPHPFYRGTNVERAFCNGAVTSLTPIWCQIRVGLTEVDVERGW